MAMVETPEPMQAPEPMTGGRARPGLRWFVPAAVAAVVLGGGAGVGALRAAAHPDLAPRDAAQLLVDLQTARLTGLSGTVVQRSDLGLPALAGIGGLGGADGLDLSTLLTGTHTLRIWYAGPDQARVALLGRLAETDIIRNGRDLWIWESRANTARHQQLPAVDPAHQPGTLVPTGLPFTPQQLAQAALAVLDPSTKVVTDGTDKVAGRDAYELLLQPRDADSLVAGIRLAIDAKEHLPLRVQVFARDGGDPALEVAFTQISFTRPDPEQFRFNPPPGARVSEGNDDRPGGMDAWVAPPQPVDPNAKPGTVKPGEVKPGEVKPGQPVPGGTKPEITKPDGVKPATPGGRGMAVVGQGWTSVLVARAPAELAGLGTAGGGPLGQLPTVSGSWGQGRVLTSRLFSLLITDDGRILIGAVRSERLVAAAADPAARLGS